MRIIRRNDLNCAVYDLLNDLPTYELLLSSLQSKLAITFPAHPLHGEFDPRIIQLKNRIKCFIYFYLD